MSSPKFEYDLQWTRDCQGKWDYDSDLIRLSCRYYPSGGGFSVLHTATGEWEENDSRPEIRPCAYVSIQVGDMEIATREKIEGDTEREVKAQVEQWANEMITRIENALLAEFKPLV